MPSWRCCTGIPYPKPGQWPAAELGVEPMLRLYFLQHGSISDPAERGGAVQFVCDAPLCRDRSRLRARAQQRRCSASSSRSTIWPAAVRRSAATLGGEGTEGGHRHDCRCDDQRALSSTKMPTTTARSEGVVGPRAAGRFRTTPGVDTAPNWSTRRWRRPRFSR